MKLTQTFVDKLTLPPGEKEHYEWDDSIPGFAVRLREGGSRNWIFQYRLGGQHKLTFGSANVLSVKDAREQAGRLHAQVKLGFDPAAEKSERKARAGETFEAAMRLFLTRQKERLRPRSYVEVERHLLVFAKALHRLPLASVDRRAIATQLTQASAATSDATANRVRASLSAFYVWAMKQGLVEINPVALTERREETSRDRVLSDGELREIWAELRNDVYGDICRLLLLLGSRRDELGALRWCEVDLDHGLISLAGERTKNNRPHEIPLSAPALAILKAQPRRVKSDGTARDFVFAGGIGFSDWSGSKIDLDRRILEARVAAAQQAGADPVKVATMPHWTLHDFRRVISTAMHDRLGIAPHVVEAVLGHVGHQAGTPGRYNRATYRDEKARALALWADHLLAIVEERESNIVPLRTAP